MTDSSPRPKRRLLSRGSILVLLALACLIGLFAKMASGVSNGETPGFDSALILAMRDAADLTDAIGPPWFEEMMRDFTALGAAGTLTLLVFSAAGYFWLNDQPRSAVLLLVTVCIAIATSQLMKAGFDRPRPELVPHGSLAMNASFPSGHSLMAAAVYLTLGFLLANTCDRRSTRIYIVLVAVLIAALVGISRVYLGVHWPTDVLGGWAIGAALALVCSLFVKGPSA